MDGFCWAPVDRKTTGNGIKLGSQRWKRRRLWIGVRGSEDRLRDLYPARPPRKKGRLKVSKLHTLYYEEYGNHSGPAALVLHGGPGAGCFPRHACFFDLDFWRVILLDQRGCGRSAPLGCLIENTTQSLIEDLEELRKHLVVDQWVLMGGSWGSALALAYGSMFPMRIQGFVLRGVCMMRQVEIDWMYQGGAARVCPEGWEMFLSGLTEGERADPLTSYYWRLLSDDSQVRSAAALRWQRWEMMVMGAGTSNRQFILKGSKPVEEQWMEQWRMFQKEQDRNKKKNVPKSLLKTSLDGVNMLSTNGRQSSNQMVVTSSRSTELSMPMKAGKGRGARNGVVPSSIVQPLLECHYAIHGGFLDDTPILGSVHRCRSIPCIAVHGRLDFVCPPDTPFQLHKVWPEMELRMVPLAGHSMYDPRIKHELLESIDSMKHIISDEMKRVITWDN